MASRSRILNGEERLLERMLKRKNKKPDAQAN
jgi:hypothetical protein